MLRFLSRLAFICNLFFLLAVSIQLVAWLPNGEATSTIAIIGYFMSIIINPLVLFVALIFYFIRRTVFNLVPKWLLIFNFIILLVQIAYLIYLNDTKHP